MKRRAAALAAALLGAACPASQGSAVKATAGLAGRPELTVLITADVRGYVGPCGCSENMRGGVARTAAQVAAVRAEGHPVLLLDAGDLLFGQLQVPAEAVGQQERKARALAQAYAAMGLDLKVLGPLDDARGPTFRTSLGLPELPAGQARVLAAGPMKVGVASGASLQQLRAAAAEARRQGAELVVGVYLQPFAQAIELVEHDHLGVDVVVASHAAKETDGEESRVLRGEVAVLQPQSKGRSLLRLDVWRGAGERFTLVRGQLEQERELAALDGRIELLRTQVNAPGLADELKHLKQGKLAEVVERRAQLAAAPPPVHAGEKALAARFVPIETSLPEEPTVKALVADYDRDVGLINLAWAKEHGRECDPPAKGQASYVGNARCRDCHEESFPVWEASKHSRGYATLESVGKQHHLDCVGCHVTGWQKNGGICRIDRTAGYQGVGCESCHGPGSVHADDPGDDNIAKGNRPATCVGCHDLENSPQFAFDTYLPLVLGPGHGRPK